MIAAPTIERSKVVRVYSGRPGCACGCRGNYSENPATITRIVARINDLGPKTYDGCEQEFVFATNEEETRTYTAYFAAGIRLDAALAVLGEARDAYVELVGAGLVEEDVLAEHEVASEGLAARCERTSDAVVRGAIDAVRAEERAVERRRLAGVFAEWRAKGTVVGGLSGSEAEQQLDLISSLFEGGA